MLAKGIWRFVLVAAAAAAVITMAEGLRHIEPDVSDSTLSTAGGLGLEVRTSTFAGLIIHPWARLQQSLSEITRGSPLNVDTKNSSSFPKTKHGCC